MSPSRADAALAPGYLVSSPALQDPHFARSLVLMAEHGADGALGFVVNRLAEVRCAEVLQAVDPGLRGIARAMGRDGAPVLSGGPVQPERLWVLWRPGVVPAGPEELRIGRGLAVGGSRALLEAVVQNDDAGPYQLVLGYAGWSPLQLEGEVAAGAWLPLDVAPDLAFEVPLEERWAEAMRRLGVTPGSFPMGGGGAQA